MYITHDSLILLNIMSLDIFNMINDSLVAVYTSNHKLQGYS